LATTRSAKHKGRWIDAATWIETYRHHHAITDMASAIGVEPSGAEKYAWRYVYGEVADA
jgi:hypothetical protein